MLEVDDLHAYYGKSHILQGVSFRVGEGEIVSLLGRNGAGRSTAVKTIMGHVPPVGSIRFRGERIDGLEPHEIARKGLGYVPGGSRDLSGAHRAREPAARHEAGAQPSGRWSLDDVFALFPVLRERVDAPGGVLSGGEQQMLTICRTLMGDPDLIMVDEPTEGLAPLMVERVRGLLEQIAARGVAILLIEQKLTIALAISHRLYVMGQGRIVFEGTRARIARQSTPCARNGSKSEPEAIIGARYELHGRVAVITLDNPPVNGLGHAMRSDVVAGLDRANADAGVRRHRPHRRRQGVLGRRRHPRVQHAEGERRADAALGDPRARGKRQAGDRGDRRRLHGRRAGARAGLPLSRRRRRRRRSRCRR